MKSLILFSNINIHYPHLVFLNFSIEIWKRKTKSEKITNDHPVRRTGVLKFKFRFILFFFHKKTTCSFTLSIWHSFLRVFAGRVLRSLIEKVNFQSLLLAAIPSVGLVLQLLRLVPAEHDRALADRLHLSAGNRPSSLFHDAQEGAKVDETLEKIIKKWKFWTNKILKNVKKNVKTEQEF